MLEENTYCYKTHGSQTKITTLNWILHQEKGDMFMIGLISMNGFRIPNIKKVCFVKCVCFLDLMYQEIYREALYLVLSRISGSSMRKQKNHMKSDWHRDSSEKAGNFLSIMENERVDVECQINNQV